MVPFTIRKRFLAHIFGMTNLPFKHFLNNSTTVSNRQEFYYDITLGSQLILHFKSRQIIVCMLTLLQEIFHLHNSSEKSFMFARKTI